MAVGAPAVGDDRRSSEDRRLEAATLDLLRRHPELSAVPVLTKRQRVVLGACLGALGLGLVATPSATLTTLCALSIVLVAPLAHTLALTVLGLVVHVPDKLRTRASEEPSLPTYTILVPLYREASVVGGLIEAIQNLDYPPEKLDVKLLLEEDDDETGGAIEAVALGSAFDVIVVPEGQPKTKPRACNYGLLHARGEYVVIYDAEDRPEPDQLRAAVAAFRTSAPDVVCIQAKLQYWNREQNLLTRWFTAEYSHRYGLYLPALERLGGPIPLGGTSNHFPTKVLRELGCWDPFNVTEDADLGARLARAGYRTCVLDSTTYEEANSRLGAWIRQRSRWIKGHIQTWLVHMRHPLLLRRELGTRRWLQFQLAFAGAFVPLLLSPFILALTVLVALAEIGLVDFFSPRPIHVAVAAIYVFGHVVYTGVHIGALVRQGYYSLTPYALLLPLYLLLMSAGAWRGLYQLITRPSYWEKTTHGLAGLAGPVLGSPGDPIGPAKPADAR